MMRRWRELRGHIDRIFGQLDQLDRRAEKMEVILMVREPAAGVAAEAYDGLRKQVVAAVTERMAHLTQLVQLDATLTAGADADTVGKMVRGFVEQASLERVTDAEHPDRNMLFEMVEDLGGGRHEVLEPAYVDAVTGRVIRRGSMRRVGPPDPSRQSGPQQAPWEES